MPKQMAFFDTTLRDGAQADHELPFGARLSLAKKAADMGVDVIEAGFPISSPGNARAVSEIARQVKGATVCALARTVRADIEAAAAALQDAERPRIHVFVSTSLIHIEKKLRSTPEAVLSLTPQAVSWAKKMCGEVQFSPEDATRTEPEYLAKVVSAAIQAGATVINIPDTVGYAQPDEFRRLLEYLYSQVPILSDVTLSVHCHNDLGLAVANSLAGVLAGATQIEGCWIGIGERAGNAALESVLAALLTRRDIYETEVGIKLDEIGPMCRKASNLTGYSIPIHQPIVGEGAFAHSSGIHNNGVQKDRQTYEIMRPEDWGWKGKTVELISNLGRSGVLAALQQLGYDAEPIIDEVMPHYKELADAKGRLTVEDLRMIVQEILIRKDIDRENLFDLVDHHTHYSESHGVVRIRRNGSSFVGAGESDGPVGSLMLAVKDAISRHGVDLSELELTDYHVVKGFGGPEANAWVIIRVRMKDRWGFGRAADPDTVKASARAFVYAINHMLHIPVIDGELEAV